MGFARIKLTNKDIPDEKILSWKDSGNLFSRVMLEKITRKDELVYIQFDLIPRGDFTKAISEFFDSNSDDIYGMYFVGYDNDDDTTRMSEFVKEQNCWESNFSLFSIARGHGMRKWVDEYKFLRRSLFTKDFVRFIFSPEPKDGKIILDWELTNERLDELYGDLFDASWFRTVDVVTPDGKIEHKGGGIFCKDYTDKEFFDWYKSQYGSEWKGEVPR